MPSIIPLSLWLLVFFLLFPFLLLPLPEVKHSLVLGTLKLSYAKFKSLSIAQRNSSAFYFKAFYFYIGELYKNTVDSEVTVTDPIKSLELLMNSKQANRGLAFHQLSRYAWVHQINPLKRGWIYHFSAKKYLRVSTIFPRVNFQVKNGRVIYWDRVGIRKCTERFIIGSKYEFALQSFFFISFNTSTKYYFHMPFFKHFSCFFPPKSSALSYFMSPVSFHPFPIYGRPFPIQR